MDQPAVQHNEHLVIFVQEILCWRRPVLTLLLAFALHSAWYYIAFSQQRPAAVICTCLLIALLVDAVQRVILPRVSWGTHLPALLPPGSPHRLMLPLRTYPELCEAFGRLRTAWSGSMQRYMAMRNREFGKATILAVAICLLLALVTNFLSGAFISYVMVLAILLVPPMERVLFFQTQGGKFIHYFTLIGNALFRITTLVSENLSLEPVTTAEMQALEEEEERILTEAMKRRARDGLSDDEDDFVTRTLKSKPKSKPTAVTAAPAPAPSAPAPAPAPAAASSSISSSTAAATATSSSSPSSSSSAAAAAAAAPSQGARRLSSMELLNSEDGFELINREEAK